MSSLNLVTIVVSAKYLLDVEADIRTRLHLAGALLEFLVAFMNLMKAWACLVMVMERRVSKNWMKIERMITEMVIIVLKLLQAILLLHKVLKMVRGVHEAVEVWAIT